MISDGGQGKLHHYNELPSVPRRLSGIGLYEKTGLTKRLKVIHVGVGLGALVSPGSRKRGGEKRPEKPNAVCGTRVFTGFSREDGAKELTAIDASYAKTFCSRNSPIVINSDGHCVIEGHFCDNYTPNRHSCDNGIHISNK